MESQGNLWKELLRKLETKDLEKLVKAVGQGCKKLTRSMMINTVVKHSLNSAELLRRAALSKNTLYAYALEKCLSVSATQTKEEIAKKIEESWEMRGKWRPRLKDHEKRECLEILRNLKPQEVEKLMGKLGCVSPERSENPFLRILDYLPSVEWLLKRKCVSRGALIRYLGTRDSLPPPQLSKDQLVSCVLDQIRQSAVESFHS